MWNFKFKLCYVCLASIAGAAEVSFSGDNKITGELVAMEDNGTLTIRTPYANDELKLDVEKITKIEFLTSNEADSIPEQSIKLINGDLVPVNIRSLDEKTMQVSSPVLGEIAIPRELIDSLQVGIFSKKSLFRGPNNINEWTSPKGEVSSWKMAEGGLLAFGSSTIYRDVKLPDSYSIRFKLSWDSNPSFQFSFSDSMEFADKASNRYFLQYGRAGLEIKRESTGNNRFSTVAVVTNTPNELDKKELWIEVRVSRKAGRIDLYLNDRLEGRYTDSQPNFPLGKGISLVSRSSSQSRLMVSEIEVSEWDERSDRHRSEDRGDTKEDAMIGRNGERFGGRLISIFDGDDGKVYRFKSNFQEAPIDLPESEVSNIFFASSLREKPVSVGGFNLFFHGLGSIQVTKCVFNKEQVISQHPLLGSVEMNRQGISRLERVQAAKTQQPKDK